MVGILLHRVCNRASRLGYCQRKAEGEVDKIHIFSDVRCPLSSLDVELRIWVTGTIKNCSALRHSSMSWDSRSDDARHLSHGTDQCVPESGIYLCRKAPYELITGKVGMQAWEAH
jgi:hypothetical protein